MKHLLLLSVLCVLILWANSTEAQTKIVKWISPTNNTMVSGTITLSFNGTGNAWSNSDRVDIVFAHENAPNGYYLIKKDVAFSGGIYSMQFDTIEISNLLQDDDDYILSVLPNSVHVWNATQMQDFHSDSVTITPNNFGTSSVFTHSMDSLPAVVSGVVMVNWTWDGELDRRSSMTDLQFQVTCDVNYGPFYVVHHYLPRQGSLKLDTRHFSNNIAGTCVFIFQTSTTLAFKILNINNGINGIFNSPAAKETISGRYLVRWHATGWSAWAGTQSLQVSTNSGSSWTTVNSTISSVLGHNSAHWDTTSFGTTASVTTCRIRLINNTDSSVIFSMTDDFSIDNSKNISQRTFRLGFSGWLFDTTISTPQVTNISNHYMAQFGDVYSYHIPGSDSLPWVEAYSGAPFINDSASGSCTSDTKGNSLIPSFAENQDRVAQIQSIRLSSGKTTPEPYFILGLNPGRSGNLGLYWGCDPGQSLPYPWNTLSLDDPMVIESYYQYAKRSVEMLSPSLLAIGIESDGHFRASLDAWNQFLNLYTAVFSKLKNDFPNLKISTSLEHPALINSNLANLWSPIMRYSDIVLVSSYPYGTSYDSMIYACTPGWRCEGQTNVDGPGSASLSQDPFVRSDIYDLVASGARAWNLPWGIHESGFPNGLVNISGSFKFYANSSPEEQKEYINLLLSNAHEHQAEIVINWTPINFEPLVEYFETISADTADTGRIWEQTGLRRGVAGVQDYSQLPKMPAEDVWASYESRVLVTASPSTPDNGSSTNSGTTSGGSGSEDSSSCGMDSSVLLMTVLIVITLYL